MSDLLSSDAPPLREPPSPDSLAVDVALERVRARLLGDAVAPRNVDRFVLKEQLGAGGMGTVWSAFDERLERTVALKFLRDDGSPGGDERRLFAEAQSLAKLSHPNVIPVYDVGRSDRRVWIAMELVPGRTLRRWCADERPIPAAILAAWLDVGRGLAAVHAAGLVHRDVKPDNVMMGDDGRVRLIDFGLVRRAARRDDREATIDSRASSTPERADLTATSDPPRSGRGFAGTPAYAAPEQLRGEPVDARADQFAYCVCLWEALTGQRPPRDPPSLPRAGSLPRRLRRALARGLAAAPERRFADMAALLAALTPRSRRWILPTALGAGLLAALAAGFSGAFDPAPADPCARAGAAIERHWGPTQRRALAAAQRPEAALDALDDWRARWSAAATEACVEVHVEHQRSPESLDRRRTCLEGQIQDLDALVASLSTDAAEPPAMAQLDALADPRACLERALLDGADEPVSEEQGAAIARLRRALFELRLGADPVALDARRSRARALRHEAEALAHRRTIGRVRLVEGELAFHAGDAAAAQEHFGAAVDVATRLPDPRLLADAWLGLARVALELDVSLERSDWLLRRDTELLASIDQPSQPTANAWMTRGRWHLLRGELTEAERATRRANALLEESGPTARWLLAAGLRNLAAIVTADGRPQEALELHARARALEGDASIADLNASRNPAGASLLAQGHAELAAGELDAAAATLDRAIDRLIVERGPQSADVAAAHVTLAAALDATGALAGARTHARAADRILREAHGVAHPERVYALSALATVAFREGAYRDAVTTYTRALELAERQPSPDPVELATHRSNLGEALYRAGDLSAAERALTEAVDALERHLGPDDPRLAVPTKALGELLLARGRAAMARPRLERALELLSEQPISETERLEAQWALARALAAADERDAALAQARAAADGFVALGPAWTERAHEITAWIDEQH